MFSDIIINENKTETDDDQVSDEENDETILPLDKINQNSERKLSANKLIKENSISLKNKIFQEKLKQQLALAEDMVVVVTDGKADTVTDVTSLNTPLQLQSQSQTSQKSQKSEKYEKYEKSLNREKSEKSYPSVFAVSLFVCTALSAILQFHILKNQYVVDRTALFLYPIVALNMPFFAEGIGRLKAWAGRLVAILLTVFAVYHTVRSSNMSSYREWYYDVHAFEVLDILKADHAAQNRTEPLRFHTSAAFQSSFSFYQQTDNRAAWLAPVDWSGAPDTTRLYDFYFIFGSDLPPLKSRYDVAKTFDGGAYFLLKKKVGE